MKLTSAAFAQGAEIPIKYTCDGSDVSPPLEWDQAPAKTGSFALVCHDPDAPAGQWVHWVAYDIPGPAFRLSEKIAATALLPADMKQGLNSWGHIGYGGPCPPKGRHRYFFRLYALDVESLGLAPGASREDVEQAMAGHVLAQAELMGAYQR
jgi:Raf kinase inhibitor-like YbhB/YbcL family protein